MYINSQFKWHDYILQTIKFDLSVDHPYSSLIKYAKCLQNKGDSAKLQKMVQMSWTFVNDSLCTTLCLQWEPEIVAVALMYLAAKLSKFEVISNHLLLQGDPSPQFLYCVGLNFGVPMAGLALLQLVTAQAG